MGLGTTALVGIGCTNDVMPEAVINGALVFTLPVIIEV